jgi:plastocyanin
MKPIQKDRRWLLPSFLVFAALVACSSQAKTFVPAADAGRDTGPRMPDAPDAEPVDASTLADASTDSATPADAWLESGTEDAQVDSGHMHEPEDASVDASTDANSSDAGADSGKMLEPGPELSPCTSAPGFLGANYLDLTDPAALREVVWNHTSVPPESSFQLSQMRCIKVRAGQKFTWNWDGRHDLTVFHVMIANGGTAPSFLPTANITKEKITATFTTPGTYGYTCAPHPSAMSGVVWVVP